MRLTAFLLLVACLQAGASGYAQKITLSQTNVSLKTIFKEIERQSEYHFFYKDRLLKQAGSVSVNVSNASVEEVLEQCFKEQPLTYTILDKTVVIKAKKPYTIAAPASTELTNVPPNIISGSVKDAQGNPLAGVSVIVRGTNRGTSTTASGSFNIEANTGDVLEFTIVGYQKKSVTVGKSNNLSVMMEIEAAVANEVVVVGYGTQKKVNLTGAVSVIGGEALEDRALVSVADALQGTAANVNIMESSLGGEPGANRSINIRGMGTLTGDGGQPYVLVDGIPMDISAVNPNDIENVSVLKDAAAAAIYGSRAPYGVILITTKHGKGKKLSINYRYNYSLRHPTMIAHFANSIESALSHQYMMANSGLPGYPDDQMQRIYAYYNGEIDSETVPISNKPNEWSFSPGSGSNSNRDYPYIVWDHWAPQQEQHVSVSGSQGGTSYYFSSGYYKQGDIMKWGDEFQKKFDFTANVTSRINNWFTVDINMKYYNNKLQRPVASNDNRAYQWGWVYTNTPLHALYSPNGDLVFMMARENELGGRENDNTNLYWTKVAGALEPIKGWQTNISYSWKNQSYRSTLHKKTVYYPFVDGTEYVWRYPIPSFTDILSSEKDAVFNLSSSYEKSAGKNYFKILVGYENQFPEYYLQGGQKMGVISPEVPSLSTSSGDFVLQSSWTHWATAGTFMRLNYNFNEKFLLELNGRYDGSSRFEGASNQYGFFPSLSVGYNISKEPFWSSVRDLMKMNNLKVRASWGSLGNQNVPDYLYLPIINTYSNLPWIIGSQRPDYTTAPQLVSPQLTWETANTLNVGVDLSFFNNRLNASFDWFTRKTLNMFGPAEKLPAVLGTSPSLRNNGELETRGFDLLIDWRGKITKDLTYSVSFVLGDNKSVVTKYNNPTGLINYSTTGNYSWYQGGTVGDIWGFVTEGIFRSDEEAKNHADQSKIYNRWLAGDIGYKDLNNDGKIDWGNNTLDNHGDLKIIGNNQPRYQYGFNATLKYKGFDINIFLQGVAKRDYFFYGSGLNIVWSRFWGFRGGTISKGLTEFTKDYWTPEGADFGGGPDAFYPKPYASSEYIKNLQTQTRYLQDASYLRLKNIRIGYSIPHNLTQKIHVDKIRFYLSGNNILTFTKLMQKFDPEALSNDVYQNGLGTTVYPIQKFYTMGVDISF